MSDEFSTKLYEALALQHEKLAPELIDGNKIVAEFVKERKRIIVGGYAIDLLLREHDAQIYPDELGSFPDIDIMTPDNIKDMQDLALLLYDKDFPNISSISAIHILTRKCRIDGRVVCDATYVPPNLFSRIPFIELKNGLRVIDPLYQKMDQHMLMSKLFTDPPRESYQNRLKKDLTRYNMLDEFYPVKPKPGKILMQQVRIPASMFPQSAELNLTTYLHGYAAYAALLETAREMLGADKWAEVQKDPEVIAADCKFTNDEFVFESPADEIHLLIDEPNDHAKPKDAVAYEELLDLVPNKWIIEREIPGAKPKKFVSIEYWRYTGILLSVGIGKVGDKELILPSVHYVLMFFLTMHFFGREELKNAHLQLYCSLRKVLNYLEPLYNDEDRSPFFLPTQTIGTVNLSQSNMIILMRIKQNLGEGEPELLCLPANFWPATSQKINNYDYDSCEFFRKGGRIKKSK